MFLLDHDLSPKTGFHFSGSCFSRFGVLRKDVSTRDQTGRTELIIDSGHPDLPAQNVWTNADLRSRLLIREALTTHPKERRARQQHDSR